MRTASLATKPLAARGLFSLHSQTRTTRKPAVLRRRVVRRSRRRLRAIFSLQYATFDLGARKHFGQPCQKHPSTKMQTRSEGKMKSGRAAPPAIRRCRLHPLIEAARSIRTSANSVVALPRLRIRLINADLCFLEKMSAISATNTLRRAVPPASAGLSIAAGHAPLRPLKPSHL